MEDEDRLLLPDEPAPPPSIFTLQYGSSVDSLCPVGSIQGYSVNHDGEDEEKCSTPLLGHKTCLLAEHLPESQADKKALKKLVIACCLCFSFMCAELVGGLLAKSLAVMTDAAHLFTDFIGFIISLSALLLARRKSTKRLSYGWVRAEVLGVLFSVELIWLVTGVLVYLAVERVRTHDFQVQPTPMLITAAFGVVVNITLSLVLHQQQIPHSHGHSHGSLEMAHGHSHANLNVRAAFIHSVGDLLQSLGVLTAALIIYFKPDYKIADPICTFIFSGLVMATTVMIFRDVVRVLMESVPKNIDLDLLRHRLLETPGILACHNFHVWSLTTDKHVCSVHVTTDPQLMSQNEAVQECHKVLSAEVKFHSITIQVENTSAL